MTLHNDPSSANAYTRRDFLMNSAVLASAAVTVPAFIQSSAFALPTTAMGMSSIPDTDEDTILVVVQLSGGNDGLNTVVPYRDDNYRRARPSIALPSDSLHILNRFGTNAATDIGLHPSLTGFRELYDQGLCAIVQGVGYPNPNRSHFASMDIWHTGETSGTGDGWLGRYIDAQCCGYGSGESGKAPDHKHIQAPIALGTEIPRALTGRKIMPVSFESAEMFSWAGTRYSNDLDKPYEQLINTAPANDDHSNSAFLMRTAMDAQISSQTIRKAVSQRPLVRYPNNSKLSRQLAMVGSMIRADMKTRVYYTSHGSFDTHANQGNAQGTHSRLLKQLADAVNAFYKDLKAQGNDKRVVVMCFSEFGRRVAQNASRGTDHGTAAPMFLFGPSVTPGIHGRHPSLTNLDNGDLKYTIDFRSVYAELLDSWMDAKSRTVLGRSYKHLRLLKK